MPPLRFALLAAAAALSACGVVARPSTRPEPTGPAAGAATGGLNTAGPWRVAASYTPQGVTIATRAVVVITGDPSTRTDTLGATLDATYSWAPGGGRGAGRRRVTGSLTGYRMAVGGAAPAVPAGLKLARPFTAEALPADGTMAFQLPAESSACTDPALSVLQGMHEAWIPLPETLTIGQEWSDTTRTLSCRDRLAVRGVNVRQFRVQRADVENSGVVVTIDRRAKGRMTADGEQFGEAVSLGGESNGTMRYVLDVASGRLLRASGTSWLDFSFKSRRRNQRVQQSSELTLTWKP
ncbi:MAG TPA: hypothetical protein VIK25_16660 [Gemmatimonadaceae bacterium]